MSKANVTHYGRLSNEKHSRLFILSVCDQEEKFVALKTQQFCRKG
jgi:hypothetical protein